MCVCVCVCVCVLYPTIIDFSTECQDITHLCFSGTGKQVKLSGSDYKSPEIFFTQLWELPLYIGSFSQCKSLKSMSDNVIPYYAQENVEIPLLISCMWSYHSRMQQTKEQKHQSRQATFTSINWKIIWSCYLSHVMIVTPIPVQ